MTESAKAVGDVHQVEEIGERADLQQTYAAIDLGSNSFHMVVATPEGDSIRIIDSLRAPVRLAAGLDKSKRLAPKTEKYALETLSQFAQRLRGVPRKNVRVVGTSTLRRAARNSDHFIDEAHDILGKRIEIISGREEARLIYGSVAHTLPKNEQRRLVIDIGGGSTELVSGKGLKPDLLESFNIGCVSSSSSWFGENRIEAKRMKGAIVHAQLELQPLTVAFTKKGWDEVIGCSGTLKATGRLLQELSLTDGNITLAGVRKLQKHFIKARKIEKLELESISKDRMQVIAGGIAIVYAIMKTLNIDQIQVSQVALREGLIFEMIGKNRHTDIQRQTIDNLVKRYHIDTHQSGRVMEIAQTLFTQAEKVWKLDAETDLDLLLWASELHEIGLSVAHSQYHKHGAYLLENSDLLGFTKAEQIALALLVRLHRRKLNLDIIEHLPKSESSRLIPLTILLRLAALLHRSRQASGLDEISFQFKNNKIHFKADKQWFQTHPLTAADLDDEAVHLRNVNMELKISVTEGKKG